MNRAVPRHPGRSAPGPGQRVIDTNSLPPAQKHQLQGPHDLAARRRPTRNRSLARSLLPGCYRQVCDQRERAASLLCEQERYGAGFTGASRVRLDEMEVEQ